MKISPQILTSTLPLPLPTQNYPVPCNPFSTPYTLNNKLQNQQIDYKI